MVSTRQVDLEMHMADLLLKSQAALDELYEYYQVGRHQGKFVEKPYLLLSHCANLLFSIWLSENEAPSGLFEYSSSLHALNTKVNLGALRYTDYVRRTVHANALQEQVKNEPKWFNFWLKVLETQDGTRPLDCREFSQTILGFVGHSGFLEGKVPRKTRKGVANLLRTDMVARIFRQSMSVLEELIAAIVFRFTRLNQSHHSTEQLVSLICMLHQVRRTIIDQVPAEGPYILLSNKDWGIPSALFRVYSGRMRGRLKVIPKRDGGSVACVYTWTSGTESKRRSWTRDFSALTHPYEELLFKTWSQETGEPLNHPEPSADARARWVLQNTEAQRLRIIFRNIETISQALVRNPLCTGLTADISGLTKRNPDDWCRTELPWTYIKELDQLLNKVKFAYREATVLGGHNPGAEVISNMWPPKRPPCKIVEQPVWRESHVTKRSQEPQSPIAAVSSDPALPPEETEADVLAPTDHNAPKGPASATELPQEESCTPTPTPTEPVAIEWASEEAQDKFDAGTESLDKEAPVAELDDEVAPEQSLDERHAVTTSEQTDDTPLPGDPTPDNAEPSPVEQATEDLPAEPLSEAVELQAAPGADAETLDDAAPVAELDDEVAPEQGLDEPYAVAASEQVRPTNRSEGQPSLTSDQPPCQPQRDACESREEGDRETPSTAGQSSDHPQDAGQDAANRASTPRAEVSRIVLRDKLMQWHQSAEGPANYEPLSLKRLRQDLEWTQSEVQRMMTTIFGRKPFTVYKQKCGDKTVCAFLEASVEASTESREGLSEAPHSSAVVAIATSDRLFCEHLSRKSNGNGGTSQKIANTQVDTEAEGASPTDKAKPDEMYHQLLDRLLEHHQLPDGRVCSDPLSLKQLQQDLAWKASEVQRHMTDIFGRRPFTAYKKKCSDGILGDFLKARDRQRTDGASCPDQTAGKPVPQVI